MRKVRKFAMLCCLAASTGTAVLAQGSKILELTLEQAVKIALDENPTIKVAEMEIERYDYVKKEIQGNLWPGVSATSSYSRSIIQQTMGGLKFGADNTFSGGLNLSLPLVVPGVYRTLSLNKEQMLGAVESARSSRITLVNEVKKACYNILLAEQSLDVLRSSEKTVGETVENTRRMFENGLVAEYDLLTAEVQLSNLAPMIIQTESSVAIAGMMLKMYLSLPQEVEVKVTGTLDELKKEVYEGSASLSADVSGNSNLKMLEIQQRILERQLRLVNSQRMPTLVAFGQAQIIGMDRRPIDFGSSIGEMLGTYLMPLYSHAGIPFPSAPASVPSKYKYDWQNPVAVGVQLSVPIFAGRTINYQAKQVKNTIKQLDIQTRYAAEGTMVQLNSAINNLITAREKMIANEKTVAQAQKACNISDTRYRAGAGTILELNVSQLNLTQARLNYSQAIYDYLSSQADYDKIVGKEN